MVLDSRLCTAVIAVDEGLSVPELDWHRLTFDSTIQISKTGLHIRYTLAADRTSIRCFRILRVALVVYAMSTSHEHHGMGGGKHVIPTNRTVTLGGAFNTSMRVLNGDGDAHAASLILNQKVPTYDGSRLTLQWKKSFPNPCPIRQIPQSSQW